MVSDGKSAFLSLGFLFIISSLLLFSINSYPDL